MEPPRAPPPGKESVVFADEAQGLLAFIGAGDNSGLPEQAAFARYALH